MQVRFGERTWPWNEKLTMDVAVQLKRDRDVTPKQFVVGLDELEPHAVDALHYIVRVEDGEPGPTIPRLPGDFNFLGDFELIPDQQAEVPSGPASEQPNPTPAPQPQAEAVAATPVPSSPTPSVAA
jgi:hypothetical protein